MVDRRKAVRKRLQARTVIRRPARGGSAGEYEVMEFLTKDMSTGGAFITSEDLSVFDLGEEVEILVDDNGERYYEGKARVVRAARVFAEHGSPVESGFGLMFLAPDGDFMAMLVRKLKD